MPFVQRVVQPVRLAQISTTTTPGTASGQINKFQCIPGKCKNNNCINKVQNVNGIEKVKEEEEEASLTIQEQLSLNNKESLNLSSRSNGDKVQGKECNGRLLLLERQSGARVKDTEHAQTRIATKAIVHNSDIVVAQTTNSNAQKQQQESLAEITLTNGCSFTYATDNEDDLCNNILQQQKKLKQHVEFLPPTSPTNKKQQYLPQQSATTAKSSTNKLVTGYEFESISNITLSNALRQLASLVLLASDIFDELQTELQSVGERTRNVQRKIIAVEQRVTAYDPKLVTVRKLKQFKNIPLNSIIYEVKATCS